MSIKTGRYRHYKGGEYEVLSTAKHSETLEEMVVYKALYGEGQLWVRPAHMWDEQVMVNGQSATLDGLSVKRFTYIGEKEDT